MTEPTKAAALVEHLRSGDHIWQSSRDEMADLITAQAALIEKLGDALAWFINDIDGTHTVMLEFDANVERARRALTALEKHNAD